MNDNLVANRIRELAERCGDQRIYTYTSFLELSEQDVFFGMEKELLHIPHRLYGGINAYERMMLRFGDEEMLGYEEEFPIRLIRIEPRGAKFADKLSHRDFLGALMNQGIERDTIGDIFVRDNTGYVYCTDTIAKPIMDGLARVRHTDVKCSAVEDAEGLRQDKPAEQRIVVNSPRIDAVIAKVYHLSRSGSDDLLKRSLVRINGRVCENASVALKENDVVSVRGYGKFEFLGISGNTAKGKTAARVAVYGKANGGGRQGTQND